jgi:hypothetical protein
MSDTTTCFVCPNPSTAAMFRLMGLHECIVPEQSVIGRRYDLILIHPDTVVSTEFHDILLTRLSPHGEIVHLARHD